MILIVVATLGFVGWLLFVRYLNGGDFSHKPTPPSWGDGGVGDDWDINRPMS